MSEEAAPAALTDDEILGRFQRTRTRAPSTETLGFRVVSVSQATMSVEAEFEARAETMANPMKLIQGGFLAGMLDEAMSTACVMVSGLTAAAPTLEMKVSFLRPARAGKMRAVGRVVRWGRTIAFTEGELYDAEDRLVAKATATALPTPFANYK
ncbi:MAG TPA: PaaI family thioesterase [Caulobacteraceae bacterium]|nr:PaaI family thioesterase [Caulobacteraceae bacterium]